MNRKQLSLVTVITLSLACLCSIAQAAETTGGLIPPPPISVPYGGRVVTEINISDADILGVIKQMIPAVGEVIATIAPAVKEQGDAGKGSVVMEALQKVDFQGLADAISGIKNIRVLVVSYPRQIGSAELLEQLDAGVAKLGRFSRIIANTDTSADSPMGLLAVYAQADGNGYVGYGFDSGSRKLFAFRLIGSADAQKLIKWGTETVKTVVGAIRQATSDETEKPQSQ